MTTTVWDAAMAAVAARLRAQITDVTLDVDRRADVGTATGDRPRLVLTLGSTPAPDLTQDPGAEHHEMEVFVSGYIVGARGDTDSEVRIATNTLRARVHAALNGFAEGAVFDVLAVGGEGAQLYEAEDSALPAGDFTQPFTVRCITASGQPYAD